MRLDLFGRLWQEISGSVKYGVRTIRIDKRQSCMRIYDGGVPQVFKNRLPPSLHIRSLDLEFDSGSVRGIPLNRPLLENLGLVLARVDYKLAVMRWLLRADL